MGLYNNGAVHTHFVGAALCLALRANFASE